MSAQIPLPPPPPPPRPYEGGPHLENPLVAPRPQKLDPELPKNMARNLDQQASYNPGGFMPQPPFQPPPPQWAPWTPTIAAPPHSTLSPAPTLPYPGPSGGGRLSPMPPHHAAQRVVSPAPTISNHVTHPPPSSPSNTPESLTAPLPTIPALTSALSTISNPSHDPTLRLAWARDVLFLVDRAHAQSTGSPIGEPPLGPVTIHDPGLLTLTQSAVPIVLEYAAQAPSPSSGALPPHVAESLFHRASLTASGSFPEHVPKNPRQAFRDFEAAARGGYGKAWFRLGRDYEGFGDMNHARECFERGVRGGVGACCYRMGMAHLLGQLGQPTSPETALPLIHRAALLSTIDTPQPAYVYALLLLGEFTQVRVDESLFFRLGLIPAQWAHSPGNTGLLQEARTHLEKSAYLHFAPAQYKLGHAYEFATPPFEFDALMSVEWYSRASQQGETEADMALSKWFLCGSRVGGPGGEPASTSEAGFDKDEQLARVFAEKAARKGLPSAEFAMGYYCEVGIGGVKDVEEARVWYGKAQSHGNTDAAERLAALSQARPQMLSRQEHDSITENKLVRTRTQAKQRSEAQKVRDGYMNANGAAGGTPKDGPPPPGYQNQPPGAYPGGLPQGGPRGRARQDGRQMVDLIRKNTLTNNNNTPPGAHGRYHTEHANSMPPGQRQDSLGGSSIQRPTSAGPQGRVPRPQQQQAYPGANRYTLVDPGSGSGSPAPSLGVRDEHRSPSRAAGRPPARRGASGGVPVSGGVGAGPGTPPAAGYGPNGPAGQAAAQSPAATTSPKAPGPQTFAEMGFTGAKAEDEKCVIM